MADAKSMDHTWITRGQAFEADNAKHLSNRQTVDYFVPTPLFERLISPKNHIILGSRGSGKTAMVRMLAHDHMVMAQSKSFASKALSQDLIGIYVPTNIGFLGSLKNKPWQSEAQAEQYFQWRLNIHCCASLIPIIASCIEFYAPDLQKRSAAEVELSSYLSNRWTRGVRNCTTLRKLLQIVRDMESERVDALNDRRIRGSDIFCDSDFFDIELFQPLHNACLFLKSVLNINNPTWLICIDEAEYLTTDQHRILNTHIRTATGNTVYKIATTPFGHHTLATNLKNGTPIQEGQDFDYIHIDLDIFNQKGNDDDLVRFARSVFARRVQAQSEWDRSKEGTTSPEALLRQILGPSPLVDDGDSSNNAEVELFWRRLGKFSNKKTLERARKLVDPDKFRNEVYRKMNGALALRDALSDIKGQRKLSIYSGERLLIRCSDGNPRRLIRLFGLLLRQVLSKSNLENPSIGASTQNELLTEFSRDTLQRIQSEAPVGSACYELLNTIGTYLGKRFKDLPLGTDQHSSILIEETDGMAIQNMVKMAVQLALLIPDQEQTRNGPDAMCIGKFHMAFVLAPLFRIPPRRGKAARLSSVLAFNPNRTISTNLTGQVGLDLEDGFE